MVLKEKLTPYDLVDIAVATYGKAGAARKIGRTPGAITHWLQRTRMPDFESVFKLCAALGISRDDVEV